MMAALNSKVIFVAIVLLVGCTKKEKEKLELKIHHPIVELRLDPHTMEDAYSMMINSQLYRGLFRYSATGAAENDLVESWKESADRLTYTFKLKTALFSNGEPITAQNVQLSFARLFLLGAAIGADIDYIKGAKKFAQTKNLADLGIRPVSENEIEFRLSFPSILFIKHMAVSDCAIFNFKTLNDIKTLPAGFSGPYKLISNSENRTVLSKWRKDSFDSKAPPQLITFFGSGKSPVELAKSGETDTLDNDPISISERNYFLDKGWGAVPTVLAGEVYIILNPKYIDLEARKYLFSKVNTVALVEAIGHPQFKPAYGLIPIGFPGNLSKEDVEHKQPSYKGRKFKFSLDYDPGVELEAKIIKYLKQAWDAPEIDFQLNPLSKAEKLERIFKKTSESSLGRKGMDYPDGISVLTYFRANYDANYFHVNDPKIDQELDNAMKEFDSTKRIDIYKKIQRLALSHYTTTPLMFGSDASGLWSSNVKHVPSHPMGYHTMYFETIEMSEK